MRPMRPHAVRNDWRNILIALRIPRSGFKQPTGSTFIQSVISCHKTSYPSGVNSNPCSCLRTGVGGRRRSNSRSEQRCIRGGSDDDFRARLVPRRTNLGLQLARISLLGRSHSYYEYSCLHRHLNVGLPTEKSSRALGVTPPSRAVSSWRKILIALKMHRPQVLSEMA